MALSEAGESVKKWWLELEDKFVNVQLDEFIVMPNHIHGIIIITDEKRNNVGAIHELPLQVGKMQRRRMLIPKIVGYLKMNSAKHINHLRKTLGIPLWQRNYYEHIIRNENELYRIREYIQNNPLRWELDRENPLADNFNLEHGLYWREIYEGKETR